jgi:hypothetical protein
MIAADNATQEDATAKSRGYARAEVLITPQWLQEHRHDPGLRIVEVDISP